MDIQPELERSHESTNKEFTVTRVNNSIVIGEAHVRINPSQREDERFSILLEENRDSIFVLESKENWSGFNEQGTYFFSEKESYNTFQTQALQFAKEKNIRLEIMDDERILKDRYGIWKEANTDFSEHDFDCMDSISLMRYCTSDQSFEKIVNYINRSEFLDESRKQTYLNGFFKYARLLQSEDVDKNFESLLKLLLSFNDYDSICREIYYQKKIAEIKKENPDKKIFAVFGKGHTDGISKTLQDSNYRTPLLRTAKMRWLLGSI